MSFFSGGKTASKAAWKIGWRVTKVGSRKARRGTVFVLRKLAVDPVTGKIVDSKLIQGYGRVMRRIADGNCGLCGKPMGTSRGKADMHGNCVLKANEMWARFETAKDASSDPLSTWNNDGYNKKNLHHEPCGHNKKAHGTDPKTGRCATCTVKTIGIVPKR